MGWRVCWTGILGHLLIGGIFIYLLCNLEFRLVHGLSYVHFHRSIKNVIHCGAI